MTPSDKSPLNQNHKEVLNLADLDRAKLENLFTELGEPKFRSGQLLRWIWREATSDFSLMTNMSQKLRQRLASDFVLKLPKIVKAQESSDGTIKYLLELADGRTVETVWIPREDQGRVTVCVSTQVGCKMGCTFCLTAQQKVERNLRAGEIAAQLLVLPNREKITNVVLMGMGEPFDNYEEVMGSLDLMNDPEGLGIGARKITVSTSGLVPKIRRFIRDSRCRLAVSLNAPNDEIRNEIMPINRAYPLDMLLGALREEAPHSPLKARFSVTFEYILIRGLNDRPEHARELVRRVHGISCKINLLLYNENPGVPYQRPEMGDVENFRRVLTDKGLLNFVRSSRGRDISAACGQLASEHKRGREIGQVAVALSASGSLEASGLRTVGADREPSAMVSA